jgi:hypothetical protein
MHNGAGRAAKWGRGGPTCGSPEEVTFVRRLAALLVMDALLLAFLLMTWLAAQAARDLLL